MIPEVEIHHTLDDAADALAARFSQQVDLSEEVVLIPDRPDVRRSLDRALLKHRVFQVETRDPTRIRLDEEVKQFILPLKLISTGYQKEDVIEWLDNEI